MIKSHLKKALEVQLPFVLYRKPNEKILQAWFQKDNRVEKISDFRENCFIMTPFSGEKSVIFYPENCYLFQQEVEEKAYISQKISIDPTTSDSTKEKHMQLVQKGIEAIHKGALQKVVLSRKETIAIDPQALSTYFQRFLQKYHSAFVYWWYHPQIGMWMGATPELLLKTQQQKLCTVALAGTMVDTGIPLQQVQWGEKEKEEQKIVTDFIVSSIQPYTQNIQISAPYTHKAGTLIHIKTDIQAHLTNKEQTKDIVQALHPTPALCGYPKEEAKKFITTHEDYNREYYGGYLGEWQLGKNSNTELYVNLRCMKIEDNKANIYLGGGINKDSQPEKEYWETVNKSKTVKNIL